MPARVTRPTAGRPGLGLLALEPRIVFDAAGLATADYATNELAQQQADAALTPAAEVAQSSAEGNADDTAYLASVYTLQHERRELVFIDGQIADMGSLLASIPSSAEIIVLDPRHDGIEQMASLLAGRSDIDAIHILSHGSEGRMHLGSTILDVVTMQTRYRDALTAIGASLSADADILIYGCDIGSGNQGDAFLAVLSELTGADIAASMDSTGAETKGGNWVLERHLGSIETTAIDAPEWNGILAPLEISVSNAPIVSGGNNVGAVGLWTNAGSVGGTPIDIRATVISADAGATVAFATAFGSYGPGQPADDMWLQITGGSMTVRWEIFASGTNQTVVAFGNPDFRISDIDGNSSVVTPFPGIEVEAVAPSLNGLTSYTLDNPTTLVAGVNAGQLLVVGTVNQNSEPTSLVGFSWTNVSSWDITYTAVPGWGTRFYFHDGDGDFTFVSAQTTFMLSVDLDANNSTAPGTAYQTTFTENDVGVPVVDTDVAIAQHSALGANLGSATVRLTNAQLDDVLSIGALPAGITATIDTSVPGQITVTLSGNALVADYQAALQAITFANTSENPSTVNRLIEVSVTNTTFGTTSNVALSTITVTAVNDVPVAVDDAFITDEDSSVTIPVLGNDTDVDGDPLTVTHVDGQPILSGQTVAVSNGAVTLNADGTLTFTPSPDYNGPASFAYTISDGALSATATVNGTVTPVNDPPVAVDDAASIGEDDLVVSGNVITNPVTGDSDVENDPLSVTAAEQAGNPITIGVPFTTAGGGVLTLNDDGSYTFEPGIAYNGLKAGETTTETIAYTIDDGNGGTATALLVITINGANDAPVATADLFEMDEDDVIMIDVLANDHDPDGEAVHITHVDGQPIVADGPAVRVENGYVNLIGNQLQFEPDPDYNGPVTFTYTVSDGTDPTTASVAGTVRPVNDDPYGPDIELTMTENGSLADRVTAFDIDGDELQYQGPIIGPNHGLVALDLDGTFTYVPRYGFSGTDSFTVSISDGNGGTHTITVHIVVEPGPQSAIEQSNTPGGSSSRIDNISDTLRVDGFLLNALAAIGALRSTTLDMSAEGVLLDTVNGLKVLDFNSAIGKKLTSESGPITRMAELSRLAERATEFGLSSTEFDARSVSGFSLKMSVDELNQRDADANNGQIVIETLIRDRMLLVEISDSLPDDSEQRGYVIRQADGRPLPQWISIAQNGLLLAQVPAGANTLELQVTVENGKGDPITRTVMIQLTTGEVKESTTKESRVPLFDEQLRQRRAN